MNNCRGHTDAVLCLQFDDVRVVSGSKDTTIKVSTLDVVRVCQVSRLFIFILGCFPLSIL